jgi:site-specific recombinase XerD
MGEPEVVLFLNHLAVDRKVAASTQSQALNALVFLYSNVLEISLPPMVGLKRVQHRHRVPVVLTQDEVRAVLNQMQGTPKLVAQVMYGAGLRVAECVTLRVKDLDFSSKAISVRSGKGSKDRTTILPEQLISLLQQHLIKVASLHKEDVLQGAGYAPLPGGLDRKFPNASRSLAWQFVFPSKVLRPWFRVVRCLPHPQTEQDERP